MAKAKTTKRATASTKKAKPKPAEADEAVNENPVTVQIHLDPDQVAPGGTSKVVIDMDVAPDHHAYRDMMKMKWAGDQAVTFDELEVQPLHKFQDPFSKKERDVVEGKAVVTAVAHFPDGMSSGHFAGKINFTFQACSPRYCLFPKTVGLSLPYSIVASNEKPTATASVSADSSGGGGLGGTFQKALAKGKFMAFLFVFIGGFLTSLTPCVFPMIPITISIIGARSAQNQKSKAFALSLSYVLGIAMTYSVLGVLAATTGAFFGSALSNIWVVGAIALIFIAMGFSMLGFYELQVPAGIRNKFGNASTGSGVPGAFLGGLFAGLVASPCIGPVLVGILAYIAQTAQVVFGFFLMFTFAMGMGILFIVLGTFSGLLTKMPKAGGWMETIKFAFGITFIAMAYFYLYPHMSPKTFDVAMAAGLFFITSYFGAFAPAPATQREQLKKGVMLAGFVGACLLMASVILGDSIGTGNSSAAVAKNGTGGATAENSGAPTLSWQPYAERVIASIPQNHKPVIVDFYADWCVACHELEKYTYNDPNVVSKGKDFDLLQITPEVESLKKKYGVIGLPTVIFIDAAGKVHEDLTITGFVKGDEFFDRMKKDL